MSSPSVIMATKGFNGSAGAVTMYFDFVPRVMFFAVDPAAGEFGFKTDSMAADLYYSTTTGADAGVTINADGTVTIAAGADINSNGNVTYVLALG